MKTRMRLRWPIGGGVCLREPKKKTSTLGKGEVLPLDRSLLMGDFSDSDMNKSIRPSLALLLNDQLTTQSTEEEKRIRLIAARTLMWLGDQRGVNELIAL